MALIAALVVSGFLHLNAINWVLRGAMQYGIIALVVVFQPELRRGLEFVGRSRILTQPFTMNKEEAKSTTTAITAAVDYFSSNKVGALIVVEREIKLSDFANTGIVLDGAVTEEFLRSIFYEGNPLHDGAAIIRGGVVHAAACVLPLSRNKDLPNELGTRHRAGIGVSEVSDALVIIGSEETGIISQAQDGTLTRFLDIRSLEKSILKIYLSDAEAEKRPTSLSGLFTGLLRRKKNA